MRSRLLLGLFLCLPLSPSAALALGGGEAGLSGGLGFSVARQEDFRPGASLEARLLRGITDSWAGRLSVQGAWISAARDQRATFFSVQDVGVTWAVDITHVVPFVDFGVVFADIRGGGHAAAQRVGTRVAIGADYLVSRRVAVSLLGRFDYFALRLAGSHRPASTLLTLALHLTAFF